MLVATVLLSLLIGVAVFSFRVQLISIKKSKARGISEAIKVAQIRLVIESMKHYAIRDYSILNLPIEGSWHYYFLGDETAMSFITTNPILANSDSLAKLSCEDNSLVYYEEPLFSDNLNYLRPKFSSKRWHYVIFKDLKECSFSYFDIKKREYQELKNRLPRLVKINLKKDYPLNQIVAIHSDDNLTATVIKTDIYESKY